MCSILEVTVNHSVVSGRQRDCGSRFQPPQQLSQPKSSHACLSIDMGRPISKESKARHDV